MNRLEARELLTRLWPDGPGLIFVDHPDVMPQVSELLYDTDLNMIMIHEMFLWGLTESECAWLFAHEMAHAVMAHEGYDPRNRSMIMVYSRRIKQQEYMADLWAIRFVLEMGYDPTVICNCFIKLNDYISDVLLEKMAIDGGLTHPSVSFRIHYMTQEYRRLTQKLLVAPIKEV